MKEEEDACSTVQIILPLKVQHILVSLKRWLDLLRLASCTLTAQDPLCDRQLLPLNLLSALNIFHTPKVSQARNRSSR